EQRAAVKLCFLLEKTAAETIIMLQTAYKEAAMSKTQIYGWFCRFKHGEISTDDEPRSGRPSTARTDENVTKIRQTILEDRRRTIDELVELTGIAWSSCQRILTEELHMKRLAAKFVPRLLTPAECEAIFDQNGMTPLPHPSYSPDLAPCDFFISSDEKRPQEKLFC
ncbi:hypothetical protein B7P43_G02445, partial [Cryptotermes secundus]